MSSSNHMASDSRCEVGNNEISPRYHLDRPLELVQSGKGQQPAVNVIPVLARYSRITSLPMKLPAARSFNAAV